MIVARRRFYHPRSRAPCPGVRLARKTIMKQLDRRSFVRQAGLLSLLACLPPAVLAQIISRTPPISPFGADSTAGR